MKHTVFVGVHGLWEIFENKNADYKKQNDAAQQLESIAYHWAQPIVDQLIYGFLDTNIWSDAHDQTLANFSYLWMQNLSINKN